MLVAKIAKEKRAAELAQERKPWVRLAGGLKHLRKETARISAAIKREFGQIEPDGRV